MAKSRTGNNKSRKSKVPMWAVAAIVVVVVAVAGYAIIRFSQASAYIYDVITPKNGMKCTGVFKDKSNGSTGYCSIKSTPPNAIQTASAITFNAGAGTLFCADVNLKDKTSVTVRQTLYSGTTKKYSAQRNFYGANTQPTGPSGVAFEWIKPGSQRLCATKQPIYMTAPILTNIDKWGLEVISVAGPEIQVYSIYKLDPNPTPGMN